MIGVGNVSSATFFETRSPFTVPLTGARRCG
jgi:hypothetical protein